MSYVSFNDVIELNGILKDKGVLCSKREGKNIFYFSKHPILGQMLDCMKSCSCAE